MSKIFSAQFCVAIAALAFSISGARVASAQAPTSFAAQTAKFNVKESYHRLERLFYLSAKTAAQSLAVDALRRVDDSGGQLRSVVITAKEKVCFSPGEPCHPDHCAYDNDHQSHNHANFT